MSSLCLIANFKFFFYDLQIGVFSQNNGNKEQPKILKIMFENFNHIPTAVVSRDCLVGIGTRYGLDGPGVESRWG